jgi:hypothetical protein
MLGFPMTSHPCHACAEAESSRASHCRGIRGQVPRSIPSGDPRGRERIACLKEAPPQSPLGSYCHLDQLIKIRSSKHMDTIIEYKVTDYKLLKGKSQGIWITCFYPHVALQTNPILRHGGGAWIPRSATSPSFASASLCRNVGPAWAHQLSSFRNSVQRSADNPHADLTI